MKKTILGLFIIGIGIVLLGNSFLWWDIDLLFKGWWTLFIIVPAFLGLFDKKSFISSLISLIIGILLLMACQNYISWKMLGQLLIPSSIILIGLAIIFNGRVTRRSVTNSKEYIAVFSSVEEQLSEVISSFSTVSVFGGIKLDLSKANIDKDITIDVVTIFGGLDIKLPKDVNVTASGVPIFGGVENKFRNKDENKVTITINYVSVFGGIKLF